MDDSMLECFGGYSSKVGNVLGHDRPLLSLSGCEDHFIRLGTEIQPLDHSDDVEATLAELLGDYWRPHLIEEKLHRRKSCCSRSQASYAASASLSLRSIQSSISLRKSA